MEHAAPSSVVIFILYVTTAFLIAHLVVERLQHRMLFTTGGEYVLLGILLGPGVPTPVVDEEVLRRTLPHPPPDVPGHRLGGPALRDDLNLRLCFSATGPCASRLCGAPACCWWD